MNPAFRARYDRVRAINAEGAAVVLPNARPTRAGLPLFEEIARWIRHFERATA